MFFEMNLEKGHQNLINYIYQATTYQQKNIK